jgi:hypothetical protein
MKKQWQSAELKDIIRKDFHKIVKEKGTDKNRKAEEWI